MNYTEENGYIFILGKYFWNNAIGKGTFHAEELDHEQMIVQGGLIYGQGRSTKQTGEDMERYNWEEKA